jgi:hypothetical protein
MISESFSCFSSDSGVFFHPSPSDIVAQSNISQPPVTVALPAPLPYISARYATWPNMEGYSKIARLMALYPEFGILRGFKQLNFQNLLYLQAEITHLEDELRDCVAEDNGRRDRPYNSTDWWSLSHPPEEQEDDHEQWDKVLEIRKKLEKYSTVSTDTAVDDLAPDRTQTMASLRRRNCRTCRSHRSTISRT